MVVSISHGIQNGCFFFDGPSHWNGWCGGSPMTKRKPPSAWFIPTDVYLTGAKCRESGNDPIHNDLSNHPSNPHPRIYGSFFGISYGYQYLYYTGLITFDNQGVIPYGYQLSILPMNCWEKSSPETIGLVSPFSMGQKPVSKFPSSDPFTIDDQRESSLMPTLDWKTIHQVYYILVMITMYKPMLYHLCLYYP